MTDDKNPAAVALGRLGGLSRSPRKSKAKQAWWSMLSDESKAKLAAKISRGRKAAWAKLKQS